MHTLGTITVPWFLVCLALVDAAMYKMTLCREAGRTHSPHHEVGKHAGPEVLPAGTQGDGGGVECSWYGKDSHGNVT